MISTDRFVWFVDRAARTGFAVGGAYLAGQWVFRVIYAVVTDDAPETPLKNAA